MKAKLTAQETLKFTRQARFGRFKDILSSAVGIVIALPLALGIFFGALFLLDALSEFDYAEYQREQKLMECLKEAKNTRAADYCQINWGPKKKDE